MDKLVNPLDETTIKKLRKTICNGLIENINEHPKLEMPACSEKTTSCHNCILASDISFKVWLKKFVDKNIK